MKKKNAGEFAIVEHLRLHKIPSNYTLFLWIMVLNFFFYQYTLVFFVKIIFFYFWIPWGENSHSVRPYKGGKKKGKLGIENKKEVNKEEKERG